MDGVLIDAKDWHYEALNKALGLFGMTIDRDAHLATFDGLPTRTKLEMLTQSRDFPIELHSFVNRLKQTYTVEIATEKCRPLFHHRYALSRLKSEGKKLAVCSNSVRQSVDLMMHLSNLVPYLDLTMSNEDVEKAKPDPQMYNYAMKNLGVSPHEVLILEDNEHGIAAAKASGAHVMIIGSTDDVRYDNIRAIIDAAENSLPECG